MWLVLVASIAFGLVGSAMGGATGFVVGFILPVIYALQMRRLRNRRKSGNY
jgi:Na+-driven multidrug efflux pump